MSISHVHSFIKAVLGDEAAAALKKAADRSEALSTVLGARTIVGWLGLAASYGYDGEVPGLPGSYLRFEKSEDDLFVGEVRLGKNTYEFQGVDLPHVAAGLSVALGADQVPDDDLRDADLAALGQNIDLLLKTQVLKSATSTEDDEIAGVAYAPKREKKCSTCGEALSEDGDCDDCQSKGLADPGGGLEKAGGTTAPGEAATQKPPAGPVGGGFTAPRSKQPSRNKKAFGTKLTASQASSKCSVCGEAQFRGDLFLGCFCLRDLAKHATAEMDGSGFHVTFNPEYWSKEDVALLMDIVEGA